MVKPSDTCWKSPERSVNIQIHLLPIFVIMKRLHFRCSVWWGDFFHYYLLQIIITTNAAQEELITICELEHSHNTVSALWHEITGTWCAVLMFRDCIMVVLYIGTFYERTEMRQNDHHSQLCFYNLDLSSFCKHYDYKWPYLALAQPLLEKNG